MNQLLTRDLEEVLGNFNPSAQLACESSLRVAAATIARASVDQITAMRVIGVLGRDDLAAFRELVAQLAEEYGLDAAVRTHVGSFSVRFSRP